MTSIRTLGCLAALALLLALPSSAAAVPPANDDFDDAQEMTGLPTEATGSNVDATREPGEPTHGHSNGAHSIWFKWTAPRDVGVTLRFASCAPSPTDYVSAIAAVYEQTVTFGLVPVMHTFRAVAGQTYFVAVDTPRGSSPHANICVRLVPGPANDDFTTATPLSGFPASASQRPGSDEGLATREPGEPTHEGGFTNSSPTPSQGSVWFSWTAPGDGLVRVRLCGYGVLGVYTGERVDALTRLATRHSRDRGCGALAGGSLMVNAAEGQDYRIAVTSSAGFQLFVENQVTVSLGGGGPFLLYTAFPGQADSVKLRLVGAGPQRAVLLRASGVTAANGCQADASPGWLRCPVPGRAAIGLDLDLRDGDDHADVRLPGPGLIWEDEDSGTAPYRRVAGGEGNDTLTGSAGFYSLTFGWRDRLLLLGEAGADRLRGAAGHDSLSGGPGPDQIAGGGGSDRMDGGRGDDRLLGMDAASDTIRCGSGRDSARLDGFDLPRECERRDLGSQVRAVPVAAAIANGDGEDYDYLGVVIECPIDAEGGCRARVSTRLGARRTSNRRIRLDPGRSGLVTDYSLSDGAKNRLLSRGARVTVTTRGRSGARVRFARHLSVGDERYEGE
jgi:hypothetical protein